MKTRRYPFSAGIIRRIALILVVCLFFQMPHGFCLDGKSLSDQISQALDLIQEKRLKEALSLIQGIKQTYPEHPAGYMLAIRVYWLLNQPRLVAFEVFRAERDHGVRDLHLYNEQANALYMLGGYAAVLQVLDAADVYLKDQLAQGNERVIT